MHITYLSNIETKQKMIMCHINIRKKNNHGKMFIKIFNSQNVEK